MQTPQREGPEKLADPITGEKLPKQPKVEELKPQEPAPAPEEPRGQKGKKAKALLPLPPGWTKITKPMCKGSFGFKGPSYSLLRAQSKKAAWLVWRLFLDRLQLKAYGREQLEAKNLKELQFIATAKAIDDAACDCAALVQQILDRQALDAQVPEPEAEAAEAAEAETAKVDDEKRNVEEGEETADQKEVSDPADPAPAPAAVIKAPTPQKPKPGIAAERMDLFLERFMNLLQKAKKELLPVPDVLAGVNGAGEAFSAEEVDTCLKVLEDKERLMLLDGVVHML